MNAQDNTTWGGTNRFATVSGSIGYLSSWTANFNVTAPSTPGTYNFQTKLVADGFAWFGATSTNVVVTVQPQPAVTSLPAKAPVSWVSP